MRVNAKEGEPGYISDDWKVLHVGRAKGQVNVNPFVMIHPALKDALQALFKWKEERYRNSQWFFPSPRPADGDAPVYRQALAHALRGASEELNVKITSHGMRAFYVKLRRSWGIPDNQIAAEIGHESGGRTLRDVYGSAPENWMLGEGPKMSWLPSKDKPAWRRGNCTEGLWREWTTPQDADQKQTAG